MCRVSWIALVVLALLSLAAMPGCDGEPTYRDRPVSYWIDASRSPNLQTKQQAIGALMTFTNDARASARLKEIHDETHTRREQNWKELLAWLQDSAQTRDHRTTITTYIGAMPDSEDGILQYTPTAFPGKWEEVRAILTRRVEQTGGQDRELYQALMLLH